MKERLKRKLKNNELFLNYLFNKSVPYEKTDFAQEMPLIYKKIDLNDGLEENSRKFLAKHTQWLLVDKSNHIYGEFEKSVIMCDDEGQISYLGEGFYSLPFILWENEYSEIKIKREKKALENGLTYKKLFEDYISFCEKEGLYFTQIEKSKCFEEKIFEKTKIWLDTLTKK